MHTSIALNNNWKIRRGNKFVDFKGISNKGNQQLYKVTYTDGSCIRVTSNHYFFTPDGRDISVKELTVGLELDGDGTKIVQSIITDNIEQTFDIIDCGNHQYTTNGILSHNCEFLSSDALLIDSLFLVNLTNEMGNIQPIKHIKEVAFYKEIIPSGTYLVGVDPATGCGEDYSVITVFEFPSMIQVAEYRSNTMSTNAVYGILINLIKYLEHMGATIYFSIENNGVGEGIISLLEADEHPPETAEFISEMGKNNRGMHTVNKVKMRACVNMKEMLERGNLHIRSSVLLAELKSFTRRKGSYEAQLGSTDDCISAVLIVIRLIEEIAAYDQVAFDKLYTGDFEKWSSSDYDGFDGEYDESDSGLPIVC